MNDGTDAQTSTSSIDAVIAAAIEDFRSGHYAPGQRLVEADLVRRYKVGRGTIREAIRRLCGEGLVVVHQFRGASIRKLSRSDMLNVLSVLEVLNGLAARQAAAAIDVGGNRERFEGAAHALLAERGRKDFYRALRERERFFATIVEISGNSELDRVMPKLDLLIARVQAPDVMPEERRFEDYRIMADAILTGDPEFAEHAARMHVRNAIACFRARWATEGDEGHGGTA